MFSIPPPRFELIEVFCNESLRASPGVRRVAHSSFVSPGNRSGGVSADRVRMPNLPFALSDGQGCPHLD